MTERGKSDASPNCCCSPATTCCAGGEGVPRRGVVGSCLAWLLGLLALGPALVSGLAAFLWPLAVKGQKGLLVRLTTIDNLPTDGSPRKFPVVAERRNAWTVSREPVGAVYLSLLPDGKVQALHAVCPHAGCAIEYRETGGGAKSGQFVCPCHLAHFDLTGKRQDAVSPRDMDPLQVEVKGNEVWVAFQNFQLGTTKRIAVA